MSPVTLRDLYGPKGRRAGVVRRADMELLYQLLAERKPEESISHKHMPAYDAHARFVRDAPYRNWYIVEVEDVGVGACYVTDRDEVGIGILLEHRRKGLATGALKLLIAAHPGRLLAHINPANNASRRLFGLLGFVGPIQVTYERP